MSKDHTKLEEVSKRFTEETLKNILCTVHKGEKAEVLAWDFDKANAKGDNYLSTVNKIKVTGIVDGKEVTISLVVKSLPTNIGRRNTYRSAEFFHNEIAFYREVIPKFQKFLEDKGQSKVLCIPRHLDSVMDGENDYIALEDVCVLGYEPISRQNCINEDECKVILRTIAKFHAISFAYKDQSGDEFLKIMKNLHETYFSKEHWNWYKRFHEKLVNITKNALAMEYPGSKAEERFNYYTPSDLYNKASELCDRAHQPTSVVCQGDSWVPNFLARKVNGNEAIMLDFQLARCTSPVLDVATCIYGCTEKTLWDEHFDKLLKLYYDELSDTITSLGSNPENLYSWNTFMGEVKYIYAGCYVTDSQYSWDDYTGGNKTKIKSDEITVKEQFIFGALFAMEMIPFSLLDESDAFDLDVLIVDDTAVDIADVWTLSNIKSQSGRLRLANIIVHAHEKGFLSSIN